ncbi:MAG: ATP-dependent RecD-like DNA helicase, partial [Planctomycetota bacterium]
MVKPGELVDAKGQWVEDARYGRQFRAEELQIYPPTSAAGMSRYLASGAIPGIGPKLAERMLKKFGAQLVDVLDRHPTRLGEVPGIGPKKLKKIIEAWEQSRAVRQIMIFLGEHGVSTSRAVRIYRQYGNGAIGIIRQNPYRLANDIWGVGFHTADTLAQRLGVDPHSPQRAGAAVIHVLETAAHAGHCALPIADVLAKTQQLTGIDERVIESAIASLAKQRQLVTEELDREPFAWLPQLYQAEWDIAQSVARLVSAGRHPLADIKTEKAIEWVQERLNIRLAADQAEAIREATRQRVLVVTGGPGVGKTTIVQSIVEIASAKGLACVLCAPTGRAAKRLEEATGRTAKTIHRLLEYSPHTGTFQRGPDAPLSGHVFIVDESSMLDARLADSFLRALPDNACVVFVGDVDQLPSVGPGNVLADLIRSGTMPVARLRTVFRQGARSQIISAAHAINAGTLPPLSPIEAGLTDFYFIDATTPEQ